MPKSPNLPPASTVPSSPEPAQKRLPPGTKLPGGKIVVDTETDHPQPYVNSKLKVDPKTGKVTLVE